MQKRFFLMSVVVFLIILAGGSGAGAAIWSHAWADKIFPGVRAGELNLGGLSKKEAEEQLARFQERFLSSSVKVVLEEREWEVSRRELGFQLHPGKIAHRAFLVGRRGLLWQRCRELWNAYHSEVMVPLQITLDRQQAEAVLVKGAENLIFPPEDARLIVNDSDAVVVVPGKPGRVLDLETALKALEQSKERPDSSVVLNFKELQPHVRTEDILAMKIDGLLFSYTTYFDVRNVNRTYNINVAADALDNQLVKPGEVFSFNSVVGPRSEEKGYKEALVIIDDQFTPGIGGGVCQVSSTLYNAILLAGLEIVERSNHSLPVEYVPLGRDATVAYGGRDLKFRNNTSGCLYLRTRVQGGALTVKIFGNTREKKSVLLDSIVDKVLEPKIIEKEDPNLYQGKTVTEREGVKGYQVRLYRVIKEGAVSKRELVSQDLYRPVNQIIRVGTMPVPETPVPPPVQDQSPVLPVEPPPVSLPILPDSLGAAPLLQVSPSN
ncbi:MAG: VanW family protein [Bacillota bacterium]|nr:VanW family protein [Bacillota bacterium]